MSAHAEHEHHIMSAKTNFMVFLTLAFLTAFTVYTAKAWDLGKFNIVLAMIIATTKATVVAWWFMHLKYDDKVNRWIFLGTLAFVFTLWAFAASDLFFRVFY
jgi:cytochrome c oxidase subunit 4